MAKLEFFAVAESMSVDQGTNKVSLFEILESVPFDPSRDVNVISKCVAVSLWRMEGGDEGNDFQVKLNISRPGEDQCDEHAINFTAKSARHRVLTTLFGLPLGRTGDLRFEVCLNGTHAAEHVITVVEEAANESQ